MANLLKPSVDQIVFSPSSYAQPVRHRSHREQNVRFLAWDDARQPVARKVAGIFRAIGAVAVLVACLGIVERT